MALGLSDAVSISAGHEHTCAVRATGAVALLSPAYGMPRFSPVPTVVGMHDCAAEALPGVKAVLTGRDLPVPFGILPVSQDEHALCPDRVRFVGDPVVDVAET